MWRSAVSLGACTVFLLVWSKRRSYKGTDMDPPPPPASSPPGMVTDVVVCRDAETVDLHLSRCLAAMTFQVVGLDAEWRPNRTRKTDPGYVRNKVSVVQVSTGSTTLVIQLLHMNIVPASLVKLLASPKVLKVGVGVSVDAVKIMEDYGVQIRGCVELVSLAARTPGLTYAMAGSKKQQPSLAKLTSRLLHVELPKDMRVRCGDWQVPVLSKAQIEYAAKDAFYSHALFEHMAGLKGIDLASAGSDQRMGGWVAGLVDAQRDKIVSRRAESKLQSPKRTQKSPDRTSRAQAKKERGGKFETVQNSLYENIRVESPEGDFMFTCDRNRATWYTTRELAVPVAGASDCIRLTFTPKGKGNYGNKYYEDGLEYKCVVCGADEKLVRHNVIPHSMKKFFHVDVKSHSSHDVLLMCVPCHTVCCQHKEVLKTTLSEEMGVLPTGTTTVGDIEAGRVRSAATAILKSGDKIPAERREDLFAKVAEYFCVPVLGVTSEMLEEASGFTAKIGRVPLEDTFEARLVAKLSSSDERRAFCQRWRRHMLDTMKPRHLSPHWEESFAKVNDDVGADDNRKFLN